MGVSGNLCRFLKEVKPLVLYACGTRDSYGANEREMGFILCWFRLQRIILHSCVDIIVHLFLRQCSWGLSGVLWRKSRLLTCLIRKTILLCTKCREIKPHLPARCMFHGISRVAARSVGYILELQRGWQFETPLCSAKSGLLSSYDGHLRNLN